MKIVEKKNNKVLLPFQIVFWPTATNLDPFKAHFQ